MGGRGEAPRAGTLFNCCICDAGLSALTVSCTCGFMSDRLSIYMRCSAGCCRQGARAGRGEVGRGEVGARKQGGMGSDGAGRGTGRDAVDDARGGEGERADAEAERIATYQVCSQCGIRFV